VIDQFSYDAPRTKALLALVGRLGVGEQKVLVLTDGVKPNVFLSGRNLPTVHVMPYQDVSTYHLLWSDAVLIEAGAIGQTLSPIAEDERDAAPKRSAAKKAAKPKAEVEARPAKKTAAKKTAAKAEAKSSAKKPAAKKSAAKKSAPKKKGK